MRDILEGYKLFDIDLYQLRSPRFYADLLTDRSKFLDDFDECLKLDEDFTCPLCSAQDFTEYLSYKKYKLFECAICSAVAPNLNLDRLAELNFHSTSIVEEDLKREILSTFEYRKQTFATERVEYLKDILPSFGNSDEYVLDVGCGPGYFLSYLKDLGIRSRGLEVNSASVSFARDIGLDVALSNLEDEPAGQYSLITMFDVLEHIPQPVNFMKMVSDKLRPGGSVLAYTPNIHSLSSLIMGGNHNMLAVFNHLCFFDRASLNFLATHSGLQLGNIDFYGLDILDYFAWKEAEDGIDYFRKLRDLVAPLQAVLDRQNLSNSMRILFTRVDAERS